jgi:RNA-directed DNA polymerase
MQVLKKNKVILYKETERFLQIKTLGELVRLLRIDEKSFNYHLNKPLYFNFKIKKKKGGEREISAPNEDLKLIQKRLNYFLQHVYYLIKPVCVHGFVLKPLGENRTNNIISNAQVHVGKSFLLNIDLKDFFSSIAAKRVKEVLFNQVSLFESEILVDVITLLCSFEGRLPTGAPTSPVMANFCCLEMDHELQIFCKEHSIAYTRYADDLSFSSNEFFTDEIILKLRSIIVKNQFEINEKKWRLLSSKSKQTVTGLVVNKKININRVYIKQIRAILHSVESLNWFKASQLHFKHQKPFFDDGTKLKNKLKGQIEFIGQVRGKNDLVYLNYKQRLNALLFI